MTTRFFLNFRKVDGTHTDFIEVGSEAFVTLGAKRSVLMTNRGFAILNGRGSMPGVDEGGEWLQFVDVPVYGLVQSNPLEIDAVFDLISLEETATETPPEPVGWVPCRSSDDVNEISMAETVKNDEKAKLDIWKYDGYGLRRVYVGPIVDAEWLPE